MLYDEGQLAVSYADTYAVMKRKKDLSIVVYLFSFNSRLRKMNLSVKHYEILFPMLNVIYVIVNMEVSIVLKMLIHYQRKMIQRKKKVR